VTELFTQIALKAIKELDIKVKSLHLDSTSFHVDGKKREVTNLKSRHHIILHCLGPPIKKCIILNCGDESRMHNESHLIQEILEGSIIGQYQLLDTMQKLADIDAASIKEKSVISITATFA